MWGRRNQEAAGLTKREQAKRLIYAVLYGCGDATAGAIVEPDSDDEHHVREVGAQAKSALIDGINGFRDLFRWLDGHNDGWIPGLDGRRLFVRKKFAALNTLLQSTGAILCKRWLLLVDAELTRRGLRHGADYEALIWSHDEIQHGARTTEIAEIIGTVCREQAVRAGEYHRFRCPTAGEFKAGDTWAETH